MPVEAIIDFYHSAADQVAAFIHGLPFVAPEFVTSTDQFVCGWHIGVDAGAQGAANGVSPENYMQGAINGAMQRCQ
ncbi:hypothetical protein L1O03_00565 [Corynebacterium uropygiale]|uniref:Uncharacterized protein n=1 Tax=Corynebacterium uropygiale TaxID=1775911 RepID=A0A9X1TYC0_9CORY|nr:hypothetical protein [Corynebacterium uropygiale]MCF4005676.1 hypothetical protein [Corynebacterium uropygiale]